MKSGTIISLLTVTVFGSSVNAQTGLSHLPGPPYLDAGANLQGRGRHPYLSAGNVYPPAGAPPLPESHVPPYYTGDFSTESPLHRPVASLAKEITSLLDTITGYVNRPPIPITRRPRPLPPAATLAPAKESHSEDPYLGKGSGRYLGIKESSYSSPSSGHTTQNEITTGWPKVFTVMGSALDAVAAGIYAVRSELTKLLEKLERKEFY